MPTASLLDIFQELQKVESTASDYYAACALQWEHDREFWAGLVKDEMAHAQHIKQAAEMIRRRPSDFTPGRSFTKEAAQIFIARIRENIEKVAHGDLAEDKALYFARIIEQALIEFKYLELVESKNSDFLDLLREVTGRTDEHLASVNKKIASLPPHS